MDLTVSIGVGRNVGDKPMTFERWRELKKQVRNAVTTGTDAVVLFDGEGDGTWQGEFEQSYCLVAVFPSRDYFHPLVKNRLRNIAAWAGQEAIGWTSGSTELLLG